ncbi:unnamed protein product, partial [Ectocarpus sp. 12 AP-2014]
PGRPRTPPPYRERTGPFRTACPEGTRAAPPSATPPSPFPSLRRPPPSIRFYDHRHPHPLRRPSLRCLRGGFPRPQPCRSGEIFRPRRVELRTSPCLGCRRRRRRRLACP